MTERFSLSVFKTPHCGSVSGWELRSHKPKKKNQVVFMRKNCDNSYKSLNPRLPNIGKELNKHQPLSTTWHGVKKREVVAVQPTFKHDVTRFLALFNRNISPNEIDSYLKF